MSEPTRYKSLQENVFNTAKNWRIFRANRANEVHQ
jgi:hypothetical protein